MLVGAKAEVLCGSLGAFLSQQGKLQVTSKPDCSEFAKPLVEVLLECLPGFEVLAQQCVGDAWVWLVEKWFLWLGSSGRSKTCEIETNAYVTTLKL